MLQRLAQRLQVPLAGGEDVLRAGLEARRSAAAPAAAGRCPRRSAPTAAPGRRSRRRASPARSILLTTVSRAAPAGARASISANSARPSARPRLRLGLRVRTDRRARSSRRPGAPPRPRAPTSAQVRSMPMRSIGSSVSRSPAVSMMFSGTPSMAIACVTRSRVVPAIGVTMATSAPASAFSRLDLPTLGAPDEHDAESLAQQRALPGGGQHLLQLRLDLRQPPERIGALEELDLLLGKVQRRLDQHPQRQQLLCKLADLPREHAPAATAWPTAPPARCWPRSGPTRPRPAPGPSCR